MSYPNASEGVKKIFTGEILGLVGTLVLLIGTGLGVVGLASTLSQNDAGGAIAAGFGTVAVLLIGSVVSVVGAIMTLIGLSTASKDQKNFKYAFYAILVYIVLAIVSGSFSANPTLQSLLTAFANAANLASTIFVIQAIIEIATQFNQVEVAIKGRAQMLMILVIQILAILANVAVSFMGGQTGSIVAGVIAIVAILLSIAQYVLYLLLLTKAKTMLETI
ncbi:MAG: hypothetical protein IK152_02295 [Lachnospiraceae bacterium]|nr:hypothetical protein [Lachnospiraceae bacterium]